ncbi:MAG: alpha-galactosidase, partial [Kiritimatiellae bacterium]|nr:alpha-galactosidase [Kiritimatiellia bacterium]
MKRIVLTVAVLAAAFGAGAADGLLEVSAGLVSRTLDANGGKLLGHSYQTADGTEFMRKGSPEFAFRVDGRMYSGGSAWKDVTVARNEAKNGSRTVTVTGVSSDDRVGVVLSYTTYPGIALVRKTLCVENRDDKDVAIEDVDVETFRLATLGCTNSRVMRRFARYREEGSVYIGDWNDPLVVVHDYAKRCGIAVGNEGVSSMKRTTAFQNGDFIVSGTPHVGERYPFRKWLKPGERWTAMPVFTAPYSNCSETSCVVEGAVEDYVRKYMGVRVEQIPKKPMFVYNTWVPFNTHIDAQLIRELADAAAECGVEEFVIDDGWQINVSDGKYGKGDWAVDEKKFPGGLKPTFDYIRSKGMRPGLWISLAFAGPSSKPRMEHPEWFAKDKSGQPANLHTTRGRDRTACLATPWRDYIRDRILALVKDHGLAYVKLDLAIATSAYVYDDARTGCYATDHPGHAGHDDSYAAIFESCMKLFDELHE